MSTTFQNGLRGRRAVVCGSTQGIGRACAEAIAAAGADVCLFARHPEALEQVRAGLDVSSGQRHGIRQVDFADWTSVRDAARSEAAENGPVTILVNNTGGPPAGPAFEARPEEYERGFAMHVLCNQVLAQEFVPGMVDAHYGRIINIISTSVLMPIKGLGVSNTVRGAVANWARSLAAELGPFGITVNNVLPGFTQTARLDALIKGRATRAGTTSQAVREDMERGIPARRFAAAEEIGSVVAFLASAGAAYVNGVNLPVDGGRLAAQ